jgi:hypothetical protein
MNIFINTVKIIKFTFIKDNNTYIFYDYITDDDLTFLQKNVNYLSFNSMFYGTILYKNFSYQIIKNDDDDFNDISSLLKNKLYKPNVRINDIIISLGQKDDDYDIEEKYKIAIDELMITTEELQKEYNNDLILTEYIEELP